MSDMAQKRDIGDPRTVRDFAKAVKTRKRLDLLTVLTVCDIRGVGPNTWNNWKAMLLRRLHGLTTDALQGGLESINREKREDEAKAALRARLYDKAYDATTAAGALRFSANQQRHISSYSTSHKTFTCNVVG